MRDMFIAAKSVVKFSSVAAASSRQRRQKKKSGNTIAPDTHTNKKAPALAGAYIYSMVYHTLISTSTPLGSSSFIRASIVFEDEL